MLSYITSIIPSFDTPVSKLLLLVFAFCIVVFMFRALAQARTLTVSWKGFHFVRHEPKPNPSKQPKQQSPIKNKTNAKVQRAKSKP